MHRTVFYVAEINQLLFVLYIFWIRLIMIANLKDFCICSLAMLLIQY